MSDNTPIKILLLSALPTNTSKLQLGEEVRNIRERLQFSRFRERFLLETREAVRPGDLTQAIFDVEPSIVHFSGHGMDTGELCFENSLGEVQPVSPNALGALFELVADQIQCVLLNACYSEVQAKAIAEHIPFVIGMSEAISDGGAIAFAVGFYKALGANQTIEKAYKFGCVEIQLLGIAEHLTPVLYKSNNSNINLVQKETDFLNEFTIQGESLKYYIYASETKVNMLYPQISPQDEREKPIVSKILMIDNFLQRNKMIGSVENPSAYIRDTLPMNWGILKIRDKRLAFFGNEKNKEAIILVGSVYHLIGRSNEIFDRSLLQSSYDNFVLRFIFRCIQDSDLEIKTPTGYREKGFQRTLKSKFRLWMSQVDHKNENVEFLARVIKIFIEDNSNFIIATPIYVALDNQII